MIQPSVTVSDQCPNLVFTDNTDYTDAKALGSYMIHNYLSGDPTVSTAYSLTSITINAVEVFGGAVNIATDAAGNIVDPDQRYQEIVAQVNSFQSTYVATFVQPDTNYKTWYVQFEIFGAGHDGEVIAVVTAPAGLTPAITNMTGGEAIDVRNLSLLLPNGTYADLGGVSQVDTLTLVQGTYDTGETFVLDFCGSTIEYDIQEGENPSACVAQGIADLVNAQVDALNNFTRVTAEANGSVVTFTAKEPGVPNQITVGYSQAPPATYFNLATTTANSPTMVPPDFDVSNEVVYVPQEDGGTYKANLTVVQGCTYLEGANEFDNWCYNITQLTCCLADKFAKVGCDCNDCAENLSEASQLKGKIDSINILQTKNTATECIQEVVNSAKAMCDELSCCTGCS